ncbi:sigma-70 family RNA polymerase sigma factor [Lactiplantibacillus garii]|uniref:Sigma-70 family RNA polymerase sigma factor n=1 Tax=Lactiplantibacillus garii TaxID=2306423 RepID=A0A3R8J5M3_9LACO|nr:sigma-70 family RNA polymerase sigma factor [Lactiplantibacillus garii]RRK09702.1 sigma-70 family RNA polymerase sigma factor [Lactiplantibacillus garii]
MKKYYDDRHQLNMEISDTKDGSMRIKLHQPTGIKEITVTEAKGKEIIELNRIEYNDNHRETRRHVSLEAYDPYGALVKDDADPLQEVINKEEMDQLHQSVSQLTPAQRKLLMKKFWDGMKQIDIAKEEGVSKMAITKRLQTIKRRLKKILQK